MSDDTIDPFKPTGANIQWPPGQPRTTHFGRALEILRGRGVPLYNPPRQVLHLTTGSDPLYNSNNGRPHPAGLRAMAARNGGRPKLWLITGDRDT